MSSVSQPIAATLTGRFLLVGYLPVLAVTLYTLVLLLAGAPGSEVSFGAAWRAAGALTASQFVLVLIGATLTAVLLTPLQLSLVRVLEGRLPRPVARRGLNRQRRLKGLLVERANALRREYDGAPDEERRRARIQQLGSVNAQLMRRFPAEEDALRPTALGNVLAAMTERAGQSYGLDAPTVWPRLYPLLRGNIKAIVDDRRDMLDVGARLSVAFSVAGLVSLVLLAPSGVWVPLAVVPFALAWIGYAACVQAAVGYSVAVEAAFDLCRFTLYAELRLPFPANPAEERDLNERLCRQWRQGVPLHVPYRSTDPPEPPPE